MILLGCSVKRDFLPRLVTDSLQPLVMLFHVPRLGRSNDASEYQPHGNTAETILLLTVIPYRSPSHAPSWNGSEAD